VTSHTIARAEKIQLDFSLPPIASTPPAGVDLWFLDLSEFALKSHAEFSTLVSIDELNRALQFKKKSANFLTTRALLRVLLAHYTGLDAQELLFTRTQHGKPFLSNAQAEIHFNLSHCNDLAVLAISACGEVGVDIESASERDYLKIAKRYFHDNELQALRDCTEADRKILFYKLWTLKEAFFKATGGGISSGLDKIYFQFDNNEIKTKFDSTLKLQENEWQFHQEFITDNTLAALVLNSPHTIKYQWFDGNAFLNNV
jgi:4'-phosphopantetheinyl transferase